MSEKIRIVIVEDNPTYARSLQRDPGSQREHGMHRHSRDCR